MPKPEKTPVTKPSRSRRLLGRAMRAAILGVLIALTSGLALARLPNRGLADGPAQAQPRAAQLRFIRYGTMGRTVLEVGIPRARQIAQVVGYVMRLSGRPRPRQHLGKLRDLLQDLDLLTEHQGRGADAVRVG